jgi:hypothetical protein
MNGTHLRLRLDSDIPTNRSEIMTWRKGRQLVLCYLNMPMILLTVRLQASGGTGAYRVRSPYRQKIQTSRKSPPAQITTTHASPLQQLVAPLSLARQRRKLLPR